MPAGPILRQHAQTFIVALLFVGLAAAEGRLKVMVGGVRTLHHDVSSLMMYLSGTYVSFSLFLGELTQLVVIEDSIVVLHCNGHTTAVTKLCG